MKMDELLKKLDAFAPFDTAEEWDNVGLLVGDKQRGVSRVLVCLDADAGAIAEAERLGADLVLSHHPLLFDPLKNLSEGYEAALLCRLIKKDIALIAMHTNLDKAPGGVNDSLLAALGLESSAQEGFVFAADFDEQLTAGALLQQVRQKLNPQTWFYGKEDMPVRRLCVCSGGGGEFFESACTMGAQAFLTGEMQQHHILRARALGLQVFIAGHGPTEEPVIEPLAARLREMGLCAFAYTQKEG